MRSKLTILAVLAISAFLAFGAMRFGLAAAPAEEAGPAPVAMIRLEGAIDVPSSEYLERALRRAEEENAQCLLVLLDTPGGLGKAMLDMTQLLLNARIPTVVYVYPAGAYAMSAGTFVTLSAHVAAMHPVSTIGAAHPIDLFSLPEPSEEAEGPGEEGKEAERARRSAEVSAEKVLNTFVQQARVIARARGRNAEWAEKAVRESAAVGAQEALELGVVDVVAADVGALLEAIDGRQIALPGDRVTTLQTAGAPIVEIPASAKERFLHVLADPNILLVLLVLAGLGIMFELQNPGAILPGVIGGLCLLLALYSMALLPVNYAGVGLIIFGMLLLVAEVKVVSHGVLTVGGITSFVIGALMLTDTSWSGALRVSWQVVIVMAVLVFLFFVFVVGAAVRAHMRRVATGEQGMIGAKGRALSSLAPTGSVLVEGERWRARAVDGEVEGGGEIEVVAQEGFTLVVRGRQGQ